MVYENICTICNPDAKKKGPLKEAKKEIPSLYVGETSRSIYERSREHWSDWRRKEDKSHIAKHQEQAHEGAREPEFIMKVVKSYRSALSRQIGEAVRIRRRGGDGRILNSKAEYSRCRIPRLVVEDLDENEREIEKMEEEELLQRREQIERELQEWSDIRFYAREHQLREKRRQLSKIERRIES